jgi:hypothetical protein
LVFHVGSGVQNDILDPVEGTRSNLRSGAQSCYDVRSERRGHRPCEEVSMRHTARLLVGALAMAMPATATAGQNSERIDALLHMATGVGHAISDASVCREITWSRVKALTDRFSDLVKTSVTRSDEFSLIQQAYDQSSVDFQRAVASKQIDCAAAVRDLADLERAVASPPPAIANFGTASAQSLPVGPPPATTGAALVQDPRYRRGR